MLEHIYLKFDNDNIAKLKSMLKKAINYKVWFIALTTIKDIDALIPATDFLVSLNVMDVDKTLLIHSVVRYAD